MKAYADKGKISFMTPPNIIILFGGSSDERRVSVASAQNVSRELPSARLWFLGVDGRVFECSIDELQAMKRPFEEDFVPRNAPRSATLAEAVKDQGGGDSVFFLALHGGEGEDGTIQKVLEARGIPFTGSGSVASAKAFDKVVTKRVARDHGVRVADEKELRGGDVGEARVEIPKMFARFPNLILKPIAGGSSIGLYRVRALSEIDGLLKEWPRMQGIAYLMEPFLEGRELTIGVYDDGKVTRALPPSEVRTDSQHDFDYQGKYLGRGSQEITPAPLDLMETQSCQEVALKMHKALGCEGYSRTDLILTSQGPVFLETNTLPGLTKASFIPQQLAAANIAFAKFLGDQVQLAVPRRKVG